MSVEVPEKPKVHYQTIKELARRELVKKRLCHFAEYYIPRYTPGWVHKDICERLEKFSQDVVEQKSPRLMLLVPPRHGKSALASICFPAWHLGHNPTHEVINVGYSVDLPMKFSRQVRDIVEDQTYRATFTGMRMNPDSRSIEDWVTLKGGGYKIAGVGGGITGKGAHVLIIDDPLKNQEEADNGDTREKLDEWYQSTAYTRLAPGGGVLFIETWWHDDDLAGRLQRRMAADPMADQFEIIKYPALAEKFEYRVRDTREIIRSDVHIPETQRPQLELLRAPGEALHPDRYTAEYLRKVRANLQTRIWSALYQQNPVPEEGAFFKAEYIRPMPTQEMPRGTRYYIGWDFAIGEKAHNDYTVGAVVAHCPNDTIWLVDVRRFRGDAHEVMSNIISLAQKWMGKPDSSLMVGFEDGQIWRSIEPSLLVSMREKKVFPSYSVLKPLTDKMARAAPLQARMQHGRFFILEDQSWFQDVKHEMLRFPAGTHDDIVDAVAWATRMAVDTPMAKQDRGLYRVKSWKEKLDKLMRVQGSGGGHMSA